MRCLNLIFLLFLSVAAFSDEYYYELFSEVPVVSTSTLTDRDSLRTANVMTIISEEEIGKTPALNLAELLNRQPGFHVYYKANSSVPSISFRGITNSQNNDKFKLLINGHPVHEPLWGEFLFGYNLSTSWIKQVEIIRGTGSALYGSGAFIGLVNIITKKDHQGLDIVLRAGSNQTYGTDVLYNGVNNETSYSFMFSYGETDGPDGTIEADKLFGTTITNAPADLMQKQEHFNFSANLKNHFVEFDFLINHADSFRPVPLLGYYTEDGQELVNDSGYTALKINLLESDEQSLVFDISYDWSEIDDQGQYFPKNFIIPSDTDRDGDIEFWPDGAYAAYGAFSDELSLELRWSLNDIENHQFLGGLFFNSVSIEDVWVRMEAHPIFFSVVPRGSDFSDSYPWIAEESRDVYGFYLQDEIYLNESMDMILGGRYDHYSDFGSTFNPRLSFVWQFDDENNGILKAVYGSAFKAPTLAQLYQSNNPVTEGNEELSEEKVDSLELQLTYVFAKALKFNISLFHMATEGLIDATDEHIDTSKVYFPKIYWNENDTELKGVEMDIKYVFNDYLSFYADYNYTDTTDDETDEELPFFPEVQAGFGICIEFDFISFNILADYTGEIKREAGDPRENLEATVEVDAALTALVSEQTSITIGVRNLTDEDIYSPTLYVDYPLSDVPQDKTSYYVEVSAEF